MKKSRSYWRVYTTPFKEQPPSWYAIMACISPLEIILRKENNHLNFPLRRSFVQEDLTGIDNQSEIKTNESFKKGFRNSFKRLSLRKKSDFPLRRSFVQEDLTGIDNQPEIKTNESFKKGFRNSFKRLSLRKKPIKEVQDSEIKDKGLLNLCRRAALLEDSNEFLSGLKKVKEAQLDRISSKQNPLIDVNQKIKGDYLLMKPVPVSTSKMWAERIQLWIKELKKPDDSCYQYMNLS